MLEVGPVAARAGVSVGLIYRHFGSKAGLLAAVVGDFYVRFDDEVLELDPRPAPAWAERERRRTELAVAFHYEDPLRQVILGRLARDPEVAAVEARHLRAQVARGTRNVARGQRRRRDPRATSTRASPPRSSSAACARRSSRSSAAASGRAGGRGRRPALAARRRRRPKHRPEEVPA